MHFINRRYYVTSCNYCSFICNTLHISSPPCFLHVLISGSIYSSYLHSFPFPFRLFHSFHVHSCTLRNVIVSSSFAKQHTHVVPASSRSGFILASANVRLYLHHLDQDFCISCVTYSQTRSIGFVVASASHVIMSYCTYISSRDR